MRTTPSHGKPGPVRRATPNRPTGGRIVHTHRNGAAGTASRTGEHAGRNIPQLQNRRPRGSLSGNAGTRRNGARTRPKR
jgi:hypothetical protein